MVMITGFVFVILCNYNLHVILEGLFIHGIVTQSVFVSQAELSAKLVTVFCVNSLTAGAKVNLPS